MRRRTSGTRRSASRSSGSPAATSTRISGPPAAPTDGPDGVCGPCSEIYYHTPGAPKPVEIWNLVFTQFNRVGAPPNNLKPLPKNNIDTGMGLERTASVLQGVITNFEIDTLKPIVLAAAETVGQKYELEGPSGRPLRRIADHVRACTMCIHEGVQPGPSKQGYIVRQLLRRALLEGYLLGKKDPFLSQVVPMVVEMMKRPYPDLVASQEIVQNVIREEEKQFLGVIDRALPAYERLAQKAGKGGRSAARKPTTCTRRKGSSSSSLRRWPPATRSRSTARALKPASAITKSAAVREPSPTRSWPKVRSTPSARRSARASSWATRKRPAPGRWRGSSPRGNSSTTSPRSTSRRSDRGRARSHAVLRRDRRPGR